MPAKPRVLLLNPPGRALHQRDAHCSVVSKARYYFPPLDLLVLSGRLAERYEVEAVDAIAERLPPRAVLDRIAGGRYRAVVALTGHTSWEEDRAFFAAAKAAAPGTLLVLSAGFLLSEGPRVLAEEPWADAALRDFTSPEVLDLLEGRREGLDTIHVRDGAAVRPAPMRRLPKRISYPTPRHDLFPLRRYRMPHGRPGPFSRMITAWGCPERCGFCIFSTERFRNREVGEALEEVEALARLGVRQAYLTDPTFAADRKQGVAFCDGLLRRRDPSAPFTWVCETRVDSVDEGFLRLMKEAGCVTIQFGVETANESVLAGQRKDQTLDRVREAFAACRRAGIRTLGHFILGLPGETEESLRETIRFAIELDPDYAAWNVAQPLFGTPLREEVRALGAALPALPRLAPSGVEGLDVSHGAPPADLPGLPRERVAALHREAIRRFYLRPRYALRMLGKVRTLAELAVLAREGFGVVAGLARRPRVAQRTAAAGGGTA
ncbi:MAG: radical SAM protein [Planctomycetales bacterium]|nr:radical SAM protein [Planctomycetales bacterium]